MQARRILAAMILLPFLSADTADAKINIAVIHNHAATATAQFKLRMLPSPSATDAAAKAKVSGVAGRQDQNGGNVDKLIDGAAPREVDQPAENFFFAAGTPGGRIGAPRGRSWSRLAMPGRLDRRTAACGASSALGQVRRR